MTIERLCYLRFVRVRLLTAFRPSSQRTPSQISLSLYLSLSAQKCLFVSDDDKEDDVIKK